MLRILSHHPNQCFDALNRKRGGHSNISGKGVLRPFVLGFGPGRRLLQLLLLFMAGECSSGVSLQPLPPHHTIFRLCSPTRDWATAFPTGSMRASRAGTRCCLPKIVGSTEICSLAFPRSLSLSGFPSHSPSVSLSLCLSAVGRPFSEWLFLASARQCLLRWQSERARLFPAPAAPKSAVSPPELISKKSTDKKKT